ncbi:MAG: hypothetical protein JXR72_07535 [Proteobacteria bacterium]|nr:hypothetical protein [Pseudomonadota bacterium]
MSFREVLGGIVRTSPGGIGAILVDDEGEMVDIFTEGDHFEMKLVGAHYAVILDSLKGIDQGGDGQGGLKGLSIHSENFTFHAAPVQKGLYAVLMQKAEGPAYAGMRALQKAIPAISGLI